MNSSVDFDGVSDASHVNHSSVLTSQASGSFFREAAAKMSSATSSSNATLYYTAVDDMFKDLLREQEEHGAAEEQAAQQVTESESWTATPKRLVRIRKHNLFGKDASEEFVICRRLAATQIESSPRSREQKAEGRRLDMLRLRRQRSEVEQKRATRRASIRI